MRNRFYVALGAIQLVVGGAVALKPLYGSPGPLTNSRALDMAFAAYFLIRGMMNLRLARRAPPASRPPEP